MTESLPNHSRIIPEPFTTSRARADQGAGNREHGTRDDLFLTLANADTRERASEDSLVSVSTLLNIGLWVTGERHPIVRTGEREPIPMHVRSAVWYRDRGRCELCTERSIDGPWHLDHITPWSAGGSDRTTNLRVLCEAHNVGRSNQIDPTERPRLPATWWCDRCYGEDAEPWIYTADGLPIGCPIHNRSERACPVKRGYQRTLELTGEIPSWHRLEQPVMNPHTIAFCAHCGVPGMTDRPL